MFKKQIFLARPLWCYLRMSLGLLVLILCAPSVLAMWFFAFGLDGFFWDAFMVGWLLLVLSMAAAEIICGLTKRLNGLALVAFIPGIILMLQHLSFFREEMGSSFVYIQLLLWLAKMIFFLESCFFGVFWTRRQVQ